MFFQGACPHCGIDNRLKRRDLNSQMWSLLVVWGEVGKESVDKPLCDACGDDLRSILIERGDEVEQLLIGKVSLDDLRRRHEKKQAMQQPLRVAASSGEPAPARSKSQPPPQKPKIVAVKSVPAKKTKAKPTKPAAKEKVVAKKKAVTSKGKERRKTQRRMAG